MEEMRRRDLGGTAVLGLTIQGLAAGGAEPYRARHGAERV